MSDVALPLLRKNVASLERELERYGAHTMNHNYQRAAVELAALKRVERKIEKAIGDVP